MREKIKEIFIKNKIEIIFIALLSFLFLFLFLVNNFTFVTGGDEYSQYRTFYITLMDKIKGEGLSFYLEDVFFGSNLASFYYYFPFDFLSLIKIFLGLFLDYDFAIFFSTYLTYILSFIFFFMLIKKAKIKDIYKVFFAFSYAFLSFGTFMQYPNFASIVFYFVLLLLIYQKYKDNLKVFLPLLFFLSLNIALSNIYITFITLFMSNILLFAYTWFFNNEEKDKYKKCFKRLIIIDTIFLFATLSSFIFNLPFLYQVFFVSFKRENLDFIFFFPLEKVVAQYLKTFLLFPINSDNILGKSFNYVFYQGGFYIGTFTLLIFTNLFFLKGSKKKYLLLFIFELFFTFFPIFALLSNALTNYYARYILFLNTFNILVAIKVLEESESEIFLFKKENSLKLLLFSFIFLIAWSLSLLISFKDKEKDFLVNVIYLAPFVFAFLYYVLKNKAIIIEIVASFFILFSQTLQPTSFYLKNLRTNINEVNGAIESLIDEGVVKESDTIKIKDNINKGLNLDLLYKENVRASREAMFHSFINESYLKTFNFLSSSSIEKYNTRSSFNSDASIFSDVYLKTDYVLSFGPSTTYFVPSFYKSVTLTAPSDMTTTLYKNDFALDVLFHDLDEKGDGSVYSSFSLDDKEKEGRLLKEVVLDERLKVEKALPFVEKETKGLEVEVDIDDLLTSYPNEYFLINTSSSIINKNVTSLLLTLKDGSRRFAINDSFASSDVVGVSIVFFGIDEKSYSSLVEGIKKESNKFTLCIVDQDKLLNDLNTQKKLNEGVKITLNNDHLDIKVDEEKLNELLLKDKENYFISLPYLYDDGWGEKAFSYNGLLSFKIEDLSLDYKVNFINEGIIISSAFLSLSLISYLSYLLIKHKLDKKEEAKEEIKVEEKN